MYGARSDVIGLRDAPNEVTDLYGRKRGRPKSTDRKDTRLTVRLTAEEAEMLEYLVERNGEKKSKLIREALVIRYNLSKSTAKMSDKKSIFNQFCTTCTTFDHFLTTFESPKTLVFSRENSHFVPFTHFFLNYLKKNKKSQNKINGRKKWYKWADIFYHYIFRQVS